MIILNIIRGMFMAFADSVPGVSGGTIAFVMGFYSQFITSLNTLVSKTSLDEKKKALFFLIKLGIGWVIGFIASVLFISSIFESHIYQISSLFLGFILFSIPLIFNEEKETIAKTPLHGIYTLIGAGIVFLITYFNPVNSGNGLNLSIEHFSFGLALYVFVAGMIAISAMVLPGISGSTLLLVFGLYAPVMSGVKAILTFDFSTLPLIICFGLGVIFGIFTVIRVISKLLASHRSQLIYLIFGLMIGSLYAVVMGPTTLKIPKAPMTLDTFSLLFFIIGAIVILGLEKLKYIIKENNA